MTKLENAERVDASFAYATFVAQNSELEEGITLIDYLVEEECIAIRLGRPEKFSDSDLEQKLIYFRGEKIPVINAVNKHLKNRKTLYKLLDKTVTNTELVTEELPIIVHLIDKEVSKKVLQWYNKESGEENSNHTCSSTNYFFRELNFHQILQQITVEKRKKIIEEYTILTEDEIWTEDQIKMFNEDKEKPRHCQYASMFVQQKLFIAINKYCTAAEKMLVKKKAEEQYEKHDEVRDAAMKVDYKLSELPRFKGYFDDIIKQSRDPDFLFRYLTSSIIAHNLNVIYHKQGLSREIYQL